MLYILTKVVTQAKSRAYEDFYKKIDKKKRGECFLACKKLSSKNNTRDID